MIRLNALRYARKRRKSDDGTRVAAPWSFCTDLITHKARHVKVQRVDAFTILMEEGVEIKVLKDIIAHIWIGKV